MADLFIKQSKQYSLARPGYPEKLFQFIASKTASHDLAWDVGTGSGQAARSLAEIFKNVIGTDTRTRMCSQTPQYMSATCTLLRSCPYTRLNKN